VQNKVSDRLKVIAKVHGAFDRHNILFFRINANMSKYGAVQALAALAAYDHTDIRLFIKYLE
tara:strand:+ start:436 stop:621 length:186 start_codon:yes stop_codon:yes gene_type:complete